MNTEDLPGLLRQAARHLPSDHETAQHIMRMSADALEDGLAELAGRWECMRCAAIERQAEAQARD